MRLGRATSVHHSQQHYIACGNAVAQARALATEPEGFVVRATVRVGRSVFAQAPRGDDMRSRDRTADSPLEAKTQYELARLPREITTALTWHMKQNEIRKQDLAAMLHVTPGRVSQILSADENITLRTLATVCAALDAHFEFKLVPNEANQAEPAPLALLPVPVDARQPATAQSSSR